MTVKELVEFLEKIPHQDIEVRIVDYAQGPAYDFECTQIMFRTKDDESPVIVLG